MTLVYLGIAIFVVLVVTTRVIAFRRRHEVPLTTHEEIADAARQGQWDLAVRSYRRMHPQESYPQAQRAVEELAGVKEQ